MTQQKNITAQAWITLFSLATIWGGSFLAFAIALRELEVFTIVAHRVAWGAIALWILVIFSGISMPRSVKVWGALIIMGALNNVIPFSLIAWAQQEVESGLAAILNSTSALFGILFAAMAFSDERLTRAKAIGALFAFLGVIIIFGLGALKSLDPRSIAQIALLVASMSYGLAAVWARLSFPKLHPVAAATGMLTGSSLIVVPLSFWVDGGHSLSLSWQTWAALAFLGIPCTAIAYLLYYRSLALAGSGNLLLVTLLIPPMAVFWGALVLSESLSANAYFGLCFIALGIIVIDGRLIKRLVSKIG